jgi:hypothetical protein
MNIGDAILFQDIALFDRQEAEEALTLVRYFFNKEKAYESQAVYLEFIDKLEKKLTAMYTAETEEKIKSFNPGLSFNNCDN